MKTKKAGVYPCNKIEGCTTTGSNDNTDTPSDASVCHLKDHLFDEIKSEAEGKKRRRKGTSIAKPHETSRGTRPVRTIRFKRDESCIDNFTKLGIKHP